MVMDPADNGHEEESKESTEKPEICERCQFWQPMLLNRPLRLGLGVCMNKDEGGSTFGLATAHFASCPKWQEREQKKVIKVPSGTLKQLRQRKLGGHGRIIGP